MLKKFFLKDTADFRYWIIFAIIVNLLFFSFNISQKVPADQKNAIHVPAGDTFSYIEPIENFLKTGDYFPDFRMPGYGAVYFLLRLMFSPTVSLNLLALMQVFLSAISVYVLALTAYYIFDSKALFYLSFYAYLFSTFSSIYNGYILTESFFTASLIFSAFYFVKAIKGFSNKALFLSGFFLTWCIFLRSVCLPLIGLYVLVLCVHYIRHKSTYFKTLKAVSVFLLFFLLLDGAWIARNYKIYGRVIPVQKQEFYQWQYEDIIFKGVLSFLQSWGGDFSWWDPKAEINWFEYIDNDENIRRQIKNIPFPEYIYTSRFNYQDLLTVKDYIAISKNKTLAKVKREEYARLVHERLNKYTRSIKEEKPYVYYVYAPLRLFRKFLFHSGTYNLFNRPYRELTIIELMFKVSMSLIYLFVVIGGLSGALILCIKNRMINDKLFVSFIALYFSTIFPFVFRCCEYRLFAPGYPFMLVCALYFSHEIYDSVLNYRKKKLIY